MYIEAAECLEQLVDKRGVAGVLEVLREVCYAKAQHIEENWQDKPLATDWSKAAKIVDKAHTACLKSGVPGITVNR